MAWNFGISIVLAFIKTVCIANAPEGMLFAKAGSAMYDMGNRCFVGLSCWKDGHEHGFLLESGIVAAG